MGSSTELLVAYDGEALKDHRIDIRDLAPALLGLAQVFEEANRVLNGNRAEVRVRVKATREGSFLIDLDLVQALARQIQGFLVGTQVTAAINLAELLGMTGAGVGGLLLVLRKLKRRRAKKSQQGASVILEIDGERIELPPQVIQLMEDVKVREGVKKMLEPLNRDGIDTFEVRDRANPKNALVVVTKADLPSFDIPDSAAIEDLPERSWTSAYSIVSLTFKEDNKWRLSDGQAVIGASITDASFLGKVNEGLPFTKGDVLVCEVTARQRHAPEGVRTEYEVTRVIEHRPAPRQIDLFMN